MENMFIILSCDSFWFKIACLSKIKELNQIVLGKGLLTSIKKIPLFEKRAHEQQSRGGWWKSHPL